MLKQEQSPCIGCPLEFEDKNDCSAKCEKRFAWANGDDNWPLLPRFVEEQQAHKKKVVPEPVKKPASKKTVSLADKKQRKKAKEKTNQENDEVKKKLIDIMRTVRLFDQTLKDMSLKNNQAINDLKKRVAELESQLADHQHGHDGDAVLVSKLKKYNR